MSINIVVFFDFLHFCMISTRFRAKTIVLTKLSLCDNIDRHKICRNGGTGRRPGLKIPWALKPVPVRSRFPAPKYIAEWSSLVARRAHNPKVIGSNPFSATMLTVEIGLNPISTVIFMPFRRLLGFPRNQKSAAVRIFR